MMCTFLVVLLLSLFTTPTRSAAALAVTLKEQEKNKEIVMPLILTPDIRSYLHLEANGTRITRVTQHNDVVSCQYFCLSNEDHQLSPVRGKKYFEAVVTMYAKQPKIKKGNQDNSVPVPSIVSQNIHYLHHPPIDTARRFSDESKQVQISDEKHKD